MQERENFSQFFLDFFFKMALFKFEKKMQFLIG